MMKNSRVRLCMSSVFAIILYYLAEAGFEFFICIFGIH